MQRTKRRNFLKASLAASAAFSVRVHAQATKRPNILFISIDDLRPELGCYGNKQIISPNIDQLAKEGLLFERAYCQRAICMPSRVSLLSGYRPETINNPPRFTHPKMPKGTVSMPQLFKNAGYQTVLNGKIYHSNRDDLEAWSKRFEDTFHEHAGWCSGYQLESNRKLIKNYFKRDNELADGLPRPASCEAADAPYDAYPEAKVAQRAIEELQRFKKSGEPFFLTAGFYRPHLPFAVPKKYWDLYPTKSITLPPNMDKVVDGITECSWDELRRYGDIPNEGPVSREKAIELIRGYYACVSFADTQVGRIITELKRLELDKNTIVVLWGDHGFNLGEHGWWSKHTNYEISTRTAMLITAPGTKGDQRTKALVELVDIYPSLCELAGLKPPAHLEGTSFVPLMKAPNLPWKSAAFSQIKGAFTIRTDRYRLIRHPGERYELFDHQSDPGENTNVAKNPEYAEVLKKLIAQLDAGWKAAQPAEAK